MLLSNLTAFPAPCNILSELSVPIILHSSIPGGYYTSASRSGTSLKPNVPPGVKETSISALPLLLHAFVDVVSAIGGKDNKGGLWKGNLHFLASVFSNITTVSFYYQDTEYYSFSYRSEYSRTQAVIFSLLPLLSILLTAQPKTWNTPYPNW